LKVYCWHCSKAFELDAKDGKKEFFVKCPYCNQGFEDLSHESQKAVLNTLKQFYSQKARVFWIYNNEIVDWKPVRTPALSWTTLTLLEALADSAKTSLAMSNIDRAQMQLNKILKILRNTINLEKKRTNQTLLKRCEYRETKRTRCNKTPVKIHPSGLYLCSYHFSKVKINQQQLGGLKVE